VRAHTGKITISNGPDGGAEIVISLPLASREGAQYLTTAAS